MMISDQGFAQLIDDIYAATEPSHTELFCDAANDVILQCATSRLSDDEAQNLYPALFRHFRFCSNCKDEFEMVMVLAQLDALNQLERPALIPSAPVITQKTWKERMQEILGIIVATIPSFDAPEATLKTRRLRGKLREATIELDDGNLIVVLTVNDSANYEEMRSLVCTIDSDNPTIIDSFAGSPIWLEVQATGDVIQNEAINENGAATFDNLTPGIYLLRLSLNHQEYAIEEVALD